MVVFLNKFHTILLTSARSGAEAEAECWSVFRVCAGIAETGVVIFAPPPPPLVSFSMSPVPKVAFLEGNGES
jgi:hypothetical protein